jgi:hypothetical protein
VERPPSSFLSFLTSTLTLAWSHYPLHW